MALIFPVPPPLNVYDSARERKEGLGPPDHIASNVIVIRSQYETRRGRQVKCLALSLVGQVLISGQVRDN